MKHIIRLAHYESLAKTYALISLILVYITIIAVICSGINFWPGLQVTHQYEYKHIISSPTQI